MTISSAIKRLQFLEDQHAGNLEIKMIDRSGDVVTDDDLVFDVSNPGTGKICALMPQSYWEETAPKGINYDSV